MREPMIFKKPPLPPFICGKCRSGDSARDWFVDIGVDTEFEGTIYLCKFCLEDIGRKTKFFMPPDELDAAIDKYYHYKVDFEAFKAIVEDNVRTFEELTGVGFFELCAFLRDRENFAKQKMEEFYARRASDSQVNEDDGNIDGDESPVDSGEHSTEESVEQPVFVIPTFS